MVRMRFAAQALDELRKLDPETPVTLRFIKQLMRTGAIPSVPVGNGNRRLLNFDALVAYLENPPAAPVQAARDRAMARDRARDKTFFMVLIFFMV